MGSVVVTGAVLSCPFGTTSSNFKATTNPTIICGGQIVGSISDASAGTNIMPFGLCKTLSNPQVAAATAAALGVLTPQPCTPQTQSWIPAPGNMVVIGGKPCLTQDCKCMCAYGGTITIKSPGQLAVRIS